MIRHFSHIFLADADTFISGDPASVQFCRTPQSSVTKADTRVSAAKGDLYTDGGRADPDPSISTTSLHGKTQPGAGPLTGL
jgi:hypothetical protein